MQTLNLSDSTPRTESRLKSLFWPSIHTGSDVDSLGSQGYWVCTIVAVVSFIVWVLAHHPGVAVIVLLFYYLSGVGVRERNKYAATAVAITYVSSALIAGLGVINVILSALLIANLRATWIASNWTPESEEAILPPRLNETLLDELTDQFPMWLWPKVEILYYVFSAGIVMLVAYSWWRPYLAT